MSHIFLRAARTIFDFLKRDMEELRYSFKEERSYGSLLFLLNLYLIYATIVMQPRIVFSCRERPSLWKYIFQWILICYEINVRSLIFYAFVMFLVIDLSNWWCIQDTYMNLLFRIFVKDRQCVVYMCVCVCIYMCVYVFSKVHGSVSNKLIVLRMAMSTWKAFYKMIYHNTLGTHTMVQIWKILNVLRNNRRYWSVTVITRNN